MGNQRRAYYCAIAAVLLWSTVASAFKVSLRHLGVLPLVFYASVVSTVVLFLWLLCSGKLDLLKTLTKSDYLRSALLGFLNPFLYYIVLLKAYSILPAQEALTLNFVWPIMLVLLSIPLLGQRISARSILAVLVSFTGVIVIATRGDVLAFRFTSAAGVSLALASSAIWALFWIYSIKDSGDQVLRLLLNFSFGSAWAAICVMLFSQMILPGAKAFLGAAYIGSFEMGVTFLVWLRALKLSKTTAHVANLIYLVPFLSVTVIRFVVGEPILFSTIAGLILIVAGIVLQEL